MDFDQFKIQVVDEMRERFPDLDIGIQAVSKLQGESYTGLAVSPAGSNVAATMNLEYVYKRVEDGMPMETALHNIEKQVAEIAGSMPQFDTRALMDYDQMKEKLTLQMIPIARNEEKLSEIPHRPVEDMALVYRFEMESNEQGSASILVTNNMLQTLVQLQNINDTHNVCHCIRPISCALRPRISGRCYAAIIVPGVLLSPHSIRTSCITA